MEKYAVDRTRHLYFQVHGFAASASFDFGQYPLLNGVFWTPQVIGGSGFIISALVLTESNHSSSSDWQYIAGYRCCARNTDGGSPM